jgi:nicotinate-nucleotide adenylyltransferase
MAVLGTEDEPWMRVSVWELERNEISYTVDTLRHFVNSHPDRAFDWIIGDDNLQSLTRWRSLDEILSMANFAVLRRTGSTDLDETLRRRVVPAEERQAAGGIVLVDNEPVVVSATAIRDRLSSGLNATGLVPPRVERYIRQNRLYANQEDLH